MALEAMGILKLLGQMNTSRHDLIEHWTDTLSSHPEVGSLHSFVNRR
jgi:hypothetical protein